MTILPDSPPRFINLNNYLWSEQWLVRYRDMDFIQNVLNGMASRRPRLDALRDSWYDLNAIMPPSKPASGSFIRG